MKLFRNIGLALASVSLLMLSAPAALAGPRIAFDAESADYGHVAFNQMVSHSFRLTNEGDEPLQITGPFCHENLIRAKALEGC